MPILGKIDQILGAAQKLKAAGGNEANTKALLIEPLLASLGWDPADLDQVEREYRVYDGTSLDYALKLDGQPRLFVEAKGIGKVLDDKSFVSQTVNYANNEGVVWCVLTNGLVYRVYRTNEPVGMEEKLLLEIDLSDAEGGSRTEIAQSLELLNRASLAEGTLDSWGEQVFTDKRVRAALAALAQKPPEALLGVLAKAVGKPAVAIDRLQESLARIIDVGPEASLPVPKPEKGPKGPSEPTKGGKEFTLDHHLGGKPAAIVDLFEQIDEFARSLGPDVSRRVRKFYVGYFAGKRSFCTYEIQRQRVIVYLNLQPTSLSPWNGQAMRDVREIGHYGMGDTEYSLTTPSRLDEVKALIKKAYEATR